MEMFVQYTSNCTHSYREPVEYGDWAEEYDFTVNGATASSRGRWGGLAHDEEKFNVAFDAEVDDTVYVLWMTYSTGDSFGHGQGYGEILWVFKDEEVAKKALRQVQEKMEDYAIDFVDDAGNVIEFSNPGSGYFENVDSLTISEFKLSH